MAVPCGQAPQSPKPGVRCEGCGLSRGSQAESQLPSFAPAVPSAPSPSRRLSLSSPLRRARRKAGDRKLALLHYRRVDHVDLGVAKRRVSVETSGRTHSPFHVCVRLYPDFLQFRDACVEAARLRAFLEESRRARPSQNVQYSARDGGKREGL